MTKLSAILQIKVRSIADYVQ